MTAAEPLEHVVTHRMTNLYHKILSSLSNQEQQFVVVGAMDGISHDELYPYASKNIHWRGLLIEPVKEYFERCRSNYRDRDNLIFENVAICDSAGQRDILKVDSKFIDDGSVPFWCNGISTFDSSKNAISRDGIRDKIISETVNCCTFADIVAKHNLQNIDILQIDAEGHDALIFQQIWDLGFRPKVIYLEIVNMPLEDFSHIWQILRKDGYTVHAQGVYGDNLLAIKNSSGKTAVPRKFRVGFFIHAEWAFGSIHSGLCKELYNYGIDADLIDWEKNYSPEDWQEFDRIYDIFVTLPGQPAAVMVNNNHIPPNKIVLIAHGKYDLDRALQYKNDIDSFRGFAGIAQSLKNYSSELGIKRDMTLLRNGIQFDRYYYPASDRLDIIGYAGAKSYQTIENKDCKRSHLVEEIASSLNLPLLYAVPRSYMRMPDFYRQVDCVIVSSDENESCGLPLMEAAAAGRLPIAANIGINKEFSSPTGLVLPTPAEDFVQHAIAGMDTLIHNPNLFKIMCEQAQDFARQNYDWKHVIKLWVSLLLDKS